MKAIHIDCAPYEAICKLVDVRPVEKDDRHMAYCVWSWYERNPNLVGCAGEYRRGRVRDIHALRMKIGEEFICIKRKSSSTSQLNQDAEQLDAFSQSESAQHAIANGKTAGKTKTPQFSEQETHAQDAERD